MAVGSNPTQGATEIRLTGTIALVATDFVGGSAPARLISGPISGPTSDLAAGRFATMSSALLADIHSDVNGWLA